MSPVVIRLLGWIDVTHIDYQHMASEVFFSCVLFFPSFFLAGNSRVGYVLLGLGDVDLESTVSFCFFSLSRMHHQ